MGQGGASGAGGKGTAAAKMEAWGEGGVQVGLNPTGAGDLMTGVGANL